MRIANAPTIGRATDVKFLLPILATIGCVLMVVLARPSPARLLNAYAGVHGPDLIAINFRPQPARMVSRTRTRQVWIVGDLVGPVTLSSGCKEFGRSVLVLAVVVRELAVLHARTPPTMCAPVQIVL